MGWNLVAEDRTDTAETKAQTLWNSSKLGRKLSR